MRKFSLLQLFFVLYCFYEILNFSGNLTSILCLVVVFLFEKLKEEQLLEYPVTICKWRLREKNNFRRYLEDCKIKVEIV